MTNQAPNIIAIDEVGDITVSTKYRGDGHYMAGIPVPYETVVTKAGKGTLRMARYSTYDEAVERHAQYVAQVKVNYK